MGDWRETLRQRLSFHEHGLGLAIGIALTAAIGFGICAYTLPIGPAKPVTGVVEGFNFKEFEEGSRTYVRVRRQGDERLLRLNFRSDCRVGDGINLEEVRTLTGVRLRVRMLPPTCMRPKSLPALRQTAT